MISDFTPEQLDKLVEANSVEWANEIDAAFELLMGMDQFQRLVAMQARHAGLNIMDILNYMLMLRGPMLAAMTMGFQLGLAASEVKMLEVLNGNK